MEYEPCKAVSEYIRDQSDKDEAVFLFDQLRFFERQTRERLAHDAILVSIKGYDMYEIRFRGKRGRHRFVGPIIDSKIYLVHAFLKQGKPQEQKEYKTAWARAKPYIKTIKKKITNK